MNARIVATAVALALGSSVVAAADKDCTQDRQCLAGVMEKYLDAVVKHEPTALPTTRNVKYTENGIRIPLGDGLWRTALAKPTYRLDVVDEEAGSVGLIGRIDENGNNNWFGVRLKVEPDGKVSQIETLIKRDIVQAVPSAAGGAPPKLETEVHPLMAQVIPVEKRMSRADLAKAGDAYFTGLDTEESGRNVPFSPECQRRENGTTTANNPAAPKGSMAWMGCKAQFDTGFSTIVTDIRERRFEVVDRTKGLAFGWGYFDHNGAPENAAPPQPARPGSSSGNAFRQPFSFYIAEVFKVMDGNIRQIEAVLTAVPYESPSGW